MQSIPMILEPRLRKNVDYLMLLAVALLMVSSLLFIYGATVGKGGSMGFAIRQGAFFGVGIVLMILVASRDYVTISRFSLPLYILNIVLLLSVLVLFKGHTVKGAARWIPLPIPGMDFKIQPSEFAKIFVIVTLSHYVHSLGTRIQKFPILMRTLAHVAFPAALILKQKDLGTAMVLVAIWFGIVFLAGARWQHLVSLIVAGLLIFVVAWKTGHLLTYQADRLTTFINPSSDPRHKGYHVLESQIAIGSGEVFGEGVGKGLQINGSFVPESHTDFIFSVVGEEGGFAGACILLSIYALLIYRGIVTINDSEDQLGQLMAGGIVTLFAFHVLINIGMTCGIVPVVGIPLPLMSYGGSAAWANLIAVGFLLSIHMRRHKIVF